MDAVYQLSVDKDGKGRIRTKHEVVFGNPVVWTYQYDDAGRLSRVGRDGAGVELYL